MKGTPQLQETQVTALCAARDGRLWKLGADDYITKPFDLEEFLARVRNVLRRIRPAVERLALGSVTVDFSARTVTGSQRALHLTEQEFLVLQYLAERRDRVMDRDGRSTTRSPACGRSSNPSCDKLRHSTMDSGVYWPSLVAFLPSPSTRRRRLSAFEASGGVRPDEIPKGAKQWLLGSCVSPSCRVSYSYRPPRGRSRRAPASRGW